MWGGGGGRTFPSYIDTFESEHDDEYESEIRALVTAKMKTSDVRRYLEIYRTVLREKSPALKRKYVAGVGLEMQLYVPPPPAPVTERRVANEGDREWESKILDIVLGKRSARHISAYIRNFRQWSSKYQWADSHKKDYIETIRKMHKDRTMASKNFGLGRAEVDQVV